MLQAPGPSAGKAVAPRTFQSYFVVRPSLSEQQQQQQQKAAPQASTSGRQHAAGFRSSHHAPQLRELRQLTRRFYKTITSKQARYSSTGLAAWTQRGGGFTPSALVWTGTLQRDIYAIASEADLPRSVAAAIVGGARSGTVSCNPGILLLQVMQLQPLQRLMGRRPLMQALRSMPSILNHDPEGLALNYASLAPAFGADKLNDMLAKCPKLLVSSPFTIWSNLLAMSHLADTDTDQAAALASRQPRLLMNSPSALRLRFQMLAELTGLSDTTVRKMVRQQPALLSYFPETLEANLMSMASTLGLPTAGCSKLVERQPSLLMLGASSLKGKIHALQQLLGASPEVTASVVLRQPSILTLSSELLASKVDGLCALLGLSRQDASDIILDQPVLLTLSSEGLSTKLTSLAQAASLRPEWQQQMEAVRPKTLAAWLCFSSTRHARFHALAAAASSPLRLAPAGGMPDAAGSQQEALKLPSLPSILRMQEARYQEVLAGLVACASKI